MSLLDLLTNPEVIESLDEGGDGLLHVWCPCDRTPCGKYRPGAYEEGLPDWPEGSICVVCAELEDVRCGRCGV